MAKNRATHLVRGVMSFAKSVMYYMKIKLTKSEPKELDERRVNIKDNSIIEGVE